MLKGTIVSNISNTYTVEAGSGLYECTARGKFKNNEIVPVVGDNVEIEIIDKENNIAVINKVIERRNFIKRPKMANLTQLVLVVSMKQPTPDLLMLDKQLAFAEFLGIKVVILLNKIDLEKNEKIQEIKGIYEQIGYKVITTNAKLTNGVEKLRELLENNISAFSGNSGVGKSTLLNAVFNSSVTIEGEISKKNKKGKNTTTMIKLYKIDSNTYIADTPGFGAFDIYEIDKDDLYRYFKEFVYYEKECKYVGCTHIKENECGIKKAVSEGKISNIRYENYVKIYNDLKEKEEHKW